MRIQQQIKIARIFFLLSAFYGLTLRIYKHVDFIPFNYKNILEAHSHIAFLGWGFLATISLIGRAYFAEKQSNSVRLKWFFKTMVFSLFALLISFPLQGYHFFSILFLSIFLLTSYLYLASILVEIKNEESSSSRFIKTGILFYFISSIAIWSIGIIVAKYGKTDLYHNVIYFYLHFLYNGFFVFALLGLFFKHIENKNNDSEISFVKTFYVLTTIVTITGYSLSLLWSEESQFIQSIALFSASLQIISLFFLWKIIQEMKRFQFLPQVKRILFLVLISLTIKVILQFLSVFPELFEHAVLFKANYIIGYIHLFTLGILSPMIFVLFSTNLNIQLSRVGLMFYVVGFIGSELILFGQGLAFSHFNYTIPYFDITLLGSSAFIFVGLLFIYFKSKKRV